MKNKYMLGASSAALLLGAALTVWAGDGHDHGDAPPAAAAKPLPVVTAVSPFFELVGRLHHDELSILIDRADTTEPVLAASLTVEVDGRSIVAPFHADHGDYALSEPDILAKLHRGGSQPLRFTLVAGDDRAVLSGELDVHAEESVMAAELHGGTEYALWVGTGVASLALVGLLARRRRSAGKPQLGGAA